MGGILGGGTPSTVEPRLGSIQVQQSVFGSPIPLVYGKTRIGGNLLDYVNFLATPHPQATGGKGGGATNTTFTYSASVAISLCQGGAAGEIGVGAVWLDKAKYATLAATTGSTIYPVGSAIGGVPGVVMATPALMLAEAGGWTLMDGSATQGAWGYMTTSFPPHGLNYRGLAYLVSANHALKSNAVLGNFNFEVRGLCRYSLTVDDANPKDVLIDFMSHAQHGCGLPYSEFGDLSEFSNWCVANSLFISPAFTAQKTAVDHWSEIMDALSCAPVYSDGKLKIIPYGDEPVTGNGVTYTPAVTPVYTFTDDDYLDVANPVIVRRKLQADAFNEVQVEHMNRASDYNLTTITIKDQAAIERFGLRPAKVLNWHFLPAPAVAAKAAQMKLQRGLYIRNEYEFKAGWSASRVEPMDVVLLNESALGLVNYPVRVMSTDEAEDGEITFVAEEFAYGISAAVMLGFGQQPSSSVPNASARPGNITAPTFIEPPLALTAGANEIWCAFAGGGDFGGCHIWMSLDGSSYQKMGSINGGARYGTLHANVPAPSANPDIINTATVDLLSADQMYSGSQFDVDSLITLCYMGGELFAYRDATLMAAQRYQLSYLRRGLYGTTAVAHTAGAAFVRLDNAIYKQALGQIATGTTLYFKFTSFNLFGSSEQSLADVTAYTHVVVGGLPSGPANLGLQLPFTGLSFTGQWTAVMGATTYEVDVWCGGVLRHVITTTATQLTYGLGDAQADGYVGRNFELKVAAMANGQLSGYSQIAFSNPLPAAITGVIGASTGGAITLDWTACGDVDLQDYQVHLSTVAGFTPGAGTLSYTGTANTYTRTGLTPGTTYYCRICARDKWGGTTWNYSAEFIQLIA